MREVSATEWRVRAEAYSLIVRRPEGGQTSIIMTVASPRLLPADAQWVVVTKPRVNSEAAKAIGLTAEQVRQFVALPTAMTQRLTPSLTQKAQLEQAFTKWLDNPRGRWSFDRELGELTTSVGNSLLPALQAEIAKSYDQARESIAPEKWAKLKELGMSAPVIQPSPTTQVTAPAATTAPPPSAAPAAVFP